MIKFGFIVVVVYFCLNGLMRFYVDGMSDDKKLKYYLGNRSFWQNLWLLILEILRLAALVFGAIAVILFLWRLI